MSAANPPKMVDDGADRPSSFAERASHGALSILRDGSAVDKRSESTEPSVVFASLIHPTKSSCCFGIVPESPHRRAFRRALRLESLRERSGRSGLHSMRIPKPRRRRDPKLVLEQ